MSKEANVKIPDSVYEPKARELIANLTRGLGAKSSFEAVRDVIISPEMTTGFLKILLSIAVVNLYARHKDKARQFIDVANIIAGLHLATLDIEKQQPKKDT